MCVKYITDIWDEIVTWCHGGVDPDSIGLEDVLLNTTENPTKVYLYKVNTKESILLDVPDITYLSGDIAHTETKMWLIDITSGFQIKEWDITLSPPTFTYNRTITLSAISSGLCAKDNNTIINNRWEGVDKRMIMEEDITGAIGIPTDLWTLQQNRIVSGDYILTTTNKFIVTTASIISPYPKYISQFDYITGVEELDIEISPTITRPYGLFIYEDEIYIACTDLTNTFGEIYHIQKTTPYALTLYDTVDYKINGASQVPSQLTTHFVV